MNRKERIAFIATEVLAVLGVPLIIWAVTDGAWAGVFYGTFMVWLGVSTALAVRRHRALSREGRGPDV
ncbi:MAG: hypothetical protein WCO88_15400 [Actinomycetota bacterium]